MKVILLRNVEGLGREGEIREVSRGYARNFLIPRQLADIATEQLIQRLEGRKIKEEKSAKKELQLAEEMAEKLDGKSFEIIRKTTDEGTLYASVNSAVISAELKKQGFIIDNKQIIAKNIKEIGEHEIIIRFNHGIEARITLIIKEENKKK